MTIQIIYNEYPLKYDSQTGSFTVGNVVYGATSAAYATIRRIDRSGTSGTLYLESISGTFQDNEVIYEATYEDELLTNGGFANWTGDDPDSWTVANEDANNYITESSSRCQIVSDNSGSIQIYQQIFTIGYFYKVSLDVKVATSGAIKITDGITEHVTGINSTGVKTYYLQLDGTYLVINRDGACDIVFDDVSVKKVTNAALANGTVQNPITINLALDRSGVIKDFKHERNIDHSYSGKVQIINQYGIQEMQINAMFSMTTYYALLAWWSWARQGKLWAFTMDSTKTGDTTLDGGAASGQKTIPLTATTGFSSTDICFLKKADVDDAWEVITIDSVSSGVSVTATENLKFNYASGDTFRHLDYWPEVVSLDGSFKPTRTGVNSTSGKYWKHTFRFTEAL